MRPPGSRSRCGSTSRGSRRTCARCETPDWVTEIKTKRAKEASDLADRDDEAKAAAFRRIGMGGKPAPGEPRGLADAKPNDPGSVPKWNPKNRGLEQPPRNHIDDKKKFVDGKTDRTRPVGTWAQFATGSDGRSKTQLHRWCICDQSKDPVNKESATYPDHFVSTQGNPINSNAHPNAGMDGSAFEKFKVDPAKAAASGSGKRKGPASAATSNMSSTVAEADLKRATAHIEHLKDQLKQLGASRDAEHLRYTKAAELVNTQLSLQTEKTNELINAHARTLRSSQIETGNAIAKIHEIRGHA